MTTDLEKLENTTKTIKEWIKTKPELPQNISKFLILFFS